MLCGTYAKVDRIKDDAYIYIAMNMHWGNHVLALPKLPKGMKWEIAFSTETDIPAIKDTADSVDAEGGQNGNAAFLKKIGPRSITVYISMPKKDTDEEKEQQ